jgi:hypothetical protein
MCICVCVCLCVYIYIHTHTHTNIYIYSYIWTFILEEAADIFNRCLCLVIFCVYLCFLFLPSSEFYKVVLKYSNLRIIHIFWPNLFYLSVFFSLELLLSSQEVFRLVMLNWVRSKIDSRQVYETVPAKWTHGVERRYVARKGWILKYCLENREETCAVCVFLEHCCACHSTVDHNLHFLGT